MCVEVAFNSGAKALFQAFRDCNPSPHLTKLHIDANKIGDIGVVHLAKAIEAGALQHLQELYIHYVDMGDEGFKSLIKAIVAQQPNPGCPRLELLNVSYNYDIGDGCVMYLAEMVKVEGAMQHLRELDVYDLGMSTEGARALLRASGEDRVCLSLDRLELDRYLPDPGGSGLGEAEEDEDGGEGEYEENDTDGHGEEEEGESNDCEEEEQDDDDGSRYDNDGNGREENDHDYYDEYFDYVFIDKHRQIMKALLVDLVKRRGRQRHCRKLAIQQL